MENPLFELQRDGTRQFDGVRDPGGQILGTYLHGLFDQPELLRELLDWAGLKQQRAFDYPRFREQQIDRLADAVEAALPLETLCRLLNLEASE